MKRFLASASLAALALAAPFAPPHLAPIGATSVLAQAAVTLENLTFRGEAGVVSVPRIVIEGSSASKAEIEALFDPGATSTLGSRLARLSARSVTIPTVEVNQTMPQASGVTTYRNVMLRDIRDGVVAEASIEQIATAVKAKPDAHDAADVDVTMGAVSMKGVDLGVLARFAFDKAQPGETQRVAVAEQSVGQTRYRIGNVANITIGEISSKDLKLRPLQVPLNDMKAQAERLAKAGDKADPMAGLGMAMDILGAMSFGEFRMKGLVGDATPPGKPALRFGVDQMTLAGAEGRGRFQLQGLKAGNGADRFELAEMAVEGLDLRSMLDTLQKVAAQGGSASDLDPATMIPKLSAIRFSGLDFDVPDTNAAGQRVRAKLGLFETKMANHIGPIPADVTMTLDRLQIDIPADTQEKGLQDILSMGYRSLDVSARFEQTWNEAAKLLTIRELSLRSAGMAALKAKAEIANVPREIFTLDQAVSSVAALGATARSLQINLTNESLFEKLIAKQARETRRRVEDVRAEMAAGATMMVPMLLGEHPAARPIGLALGKFVAEPKNLTIDVKARGEGIGATDFLAVGNPMDLLKKLDITATANQ